MRVYLNQPSNSIPVFYPKNRKAAFTLVEVLAGVAVIALAAVGSIQAMLVLNRQAMTSRVLTNARVLVQEKINEALVIPYSPDANPPVIPTQLQVTNAPVSETVTIAKDIDGKAQVSGNLTHKVKELSPDGIIKMRKVTVTLDYTYLGRSRTITMSTLRAPDIR